MPKALEQKLRKQYKAKGLTGKRLDRAVYGTMQKVTDWKPSDKKRKGRKKTFEKE